MNKSRRDFFRNLGRKTAGVAATVVTPTLAHAEQLGMQFSEQIEKVGADLGSRISETASEAREQIQGVSDRIDTAALLAGYQQAQINLLFLLLAISFAIDGGMTLFWALYSPAPVVAV